MVSTRGVKARFTEGERVLCYEPDPTKAKVLYESKVLQIVYNKDGSRGKRQLEYLIHFQGWNASWDRCVDEDLVLKDTDENRDLQKRLMENTHLKLKEKKKKRRLSDTIREIVQEREKLRREEGGSAAGSQCGGSDEDGGVSEADSSGASSDDSRAILAAAAAAAPHVQGSSDSSSVGSSSAAGAEQHSSITAPLPTGDQAYSKEFPIDIPVALKTVLERDYHLIKGKKKVLQLPCPPAALTVLENYVLFFATRYLARTSERRRNETKLKDKAYLTLDLCKEVMDGVRVCFDFHCSSHLLYTEEQQQAGTLATLLPQHLTQHSTSHTLHKFANNTENGTEEKPKFAEDKLKPCSNSEEASGGRRLTRSAGRPSLPTDAVAATAAVAAAVSESGRSTPVTVSSASSIYQQFAAKQQPAAATAECQQQQQQSSVLPPLGHLSHQLSSWTLLPHAYRTTGTATLVYGPLHLLRLFVKLPEILYRMNLPPEKRKIIIKHLQLFLEYLDVHNQEFFSESHYISSTAC